MDRGLGKSGRQELGETDKVRVAQRAVLSESSIWHTHYQAELERLEAGLSDLTLAEEVEWIVCQSASCMTSQRDEKGYSEVVKRVARMHDRLAGWMESEGATQPALSVARADEVHRRFQAMPSLMLREGASDVVSGAAAMVRHS